MASAQPLGMAPPAAVSQRSLKLMKGSLSYINVLIKAMPDLWSPSNQEGWVPLVVAENKLGNEAVLERLQAVQAFPQWVMNYGGMKGSDGLRAAMASLMNHTFVRAVNLDPNDICISAGSSAILDNLFYCIADEGQSVLIPAPYYPAFDNDLQAKCHLHPLPFFLDESADVAAQLDAAAAAAAARGQPIRSLLITNPNNPLGTIYREDTVAAMLAWCLGNKVHYVSDEVYALSTYKPATFTSALDIAQRLVAGGSEDGAAAGRSQADVDSYVHLVYGLSKDWCASGLRVGLLYSRNKLLQQALNSLAPFASISNHTQHALTEVLSDLEWAAAFTAANQRALEGSYDVLAAGLSRAGIPFAPAVAGMFVWVDLRQWLPGEGWEAEAALWGAICDECKVILTPGKSCHAAEPGYFRLCFAWMPVEALQQAVCRLERKLGK